MKYICKNYLTYATSIPETITNNINGYIINNALFLGNYNKELNDFLELIESKKCVTGYIMTSGIFSLYLIMNFKNYKEFDYSIKTSKCNNR